MKAKSFKFAAMTVREANQRLLFQLYHDYDNREASNIADWLMEKLTGWRKIDRVVNDRVPLSEEAEKILASYLAGIEQHRPVQYILKEAWFYGLKFYVDENVLIPRPETEELVSWVLSEADLSASAVLDIGTGSGCISVSIKKKSPRTVVFACDISASVLSVAEKNARAHQTAVQLIRADFLEKKDWEKLPAVKFIVSNPPYIPKSNQDAIQANVIHHEPHLALFVSNDDPLVFYKNIAAFGKEKSVDDMRIFAETHEDLARETANVFREYGYLNVEIKKDMQGKERMIRAY